MPNLVNTYELETNFSASGAALRATGRSDQVPVQDTAKPAAAVMEKLLGEFRRSIG